MEKILISACLVGDKTRYDGKDNYWPFVEELSKHYTLIPFCPEVSGGLPTPRLPAEISHNSVIRKDGADVTANYNSGAEKALAACRLFGIKIAILKDNSPSCGPRHIHDGKFTDTKIEGLGVTARLLIENAIKVYAETDSLDFLLGDSQERKDARLKRNLERAEEIKTAKAAGLPIPPRKTASRGRFGKKGGSFGDKKRYAPRREGAGEGAESRGSYSGDRPYSAARKPGYKKNYGGSSYHKDYSHEGYNSDYKKPYEGGSEGGYHKDYKKPYGSSSSYHKDYKKPYGSEGGYKKPYSGEGSYHSDYKKPYEGGSEGGYHKDYKKPYGSSSSYHKDYKKPYGSEGGYKKNYSKKPYSGGSSHHKDGSSYGDKKPYYKKKSYGGNGGSKKDYHSPKGIYVKKSEPKGE